MAASVVSIKIYFFEERKYVHFRHTFLLKEHMFCHLTCQMVCYTEPSEKLSLETVWERAGTFKKYLAGDWMNHLSITVLPCETAGFARSRENPHRTLIGPNHNTSA